MAYKVSRFITTIAEHVLEGDNVCAGTVFFSFNIGILSLFKIYYFIPSTSYQYRLVTKVQCS